MPGIVDAYLAQLSSWSGVDYLVACVFVAEALGMVLVRYRSGGRLRWLSPLVPLLLGGWALLLGQFADGMYQKLVKAASDTSCGHCSPVVGQIWRAQVVEAYNRDYPQSVLLMVACFVCLVGVLYMRWRPSNMPHAVSRGALSVAV